MAFTGKYVLESQENYTEFLKALGKRRVHANIIKYVRSSGLLCVDKCFIFSTGIEDPKGDKIITDIYQNDNFRLTKFLMNKTWSNTFDIGKESELETLNGETFKVISYL